MPANNSRKTVRSLLLSLNTHNRNKSRNRINTNRTNNNNFQRNIDTNHSEDNHKNNRNCNADGKTQWGEDVDTSIPSKYLCPLTMEIMDKPVVTRTGHNFERDALLSWLETGNRTCPMTREPLSLSDIINNRNLRAEINQWKEENGYISTVGKTNPPLVDGKRSGTEDETDDDNPSDDEDNVNLHIFVTLPL